MSFTSINPATGGVIATYPEHAAPEVERRLALATTCFVSWRSRSFADRAAPMRRLAELFREQRRPLAEEITREMGRPITAALAEVEKCALACEFYATAAAEFLAEERIATEFRESFVRFDPLGIVLAVMPWNFPYWQVMRFAAPALMAGNVGLLKHASNVQGTALALERLFRESGFPDGAFQNLAIPASGVERVVRDPRVQAVTLTGSEHAGASVAGIAGQEIKKTVLELGGSDPFIVLADADVDAACAVAVAARLQNAGQSCIAAKRFIVDAAITDRFTACFRERFESMVIGDPMDERTTLGPLISARGREDVARQVERSVAMGATVVTGGGSLPGPGFFYAPTILTNVRKGMPVYDEETFGPVAAVITVHGVEEAVRVANDTLFGLGSAIWTRDLAVAKRVAGELRAGFVAVNGMVKSDPRLPFGGIGKSGYGRELSSFGIREFVNVKTVTVA